MTDVRSISWVLVRKNWTQEHWDLFNSEACKAMYAICGNEVGEKGTPQLKAYIRYKHAKAYFFKKYSTSSS